MISAENVNCQFPKYPMTVNDKGWIYGVWYCGTSWNKVKLYGQYPPTFLKRALSLFPLADKILHCPSGTLTGPDICVDLIVDNVRRPTVQAKADCLPFMNDSFDLVLSDPPYSDRDSEKYGCSPFPLRRMMKEVHRVLKPNGYLGILHTYYPSYKRKQWKLRALIGVVTGFQRATRIFSVFQKIDEVDK